MTIRQFFQTPMIEQWPVPLDMAVKVIVFVIVCAAVGVSYAVDFVRLITKFIVNIMDRTTMEDQQ